ncbi:hypothetical protein B0J12DRAFT_704276 [Macrophomina phaseolina]|uniref:Xylanolytic transcriptional activator regulatory domain-containing protein n=1 Tax=Macrophomina phaseolina TaxID=35725 RepID=A0ABQ8FVW2_9PEZI|nr:hypothetical protein B0J12DRAFT_704276 [Macrophomina phaseolina]
MGSPMQIVELGTLRARENEESSFLGSSTGVYFVNTVRNAFKASKDPGAHSADSPSLIDPEQEEPNPLEDFLLDERTPWPSSESRSLQEATRSVFQIVAPSVSLCPWPAFIQEIEALYDPAKPAFNPPGNDPDRHRCCRAIIAQCILNVAQAGIAKEILPRHSRIESSQSLIFSLSSLATKQDLHSLQALLAAQLYFVCAGSFRSASAVGGMLNKSLFHGGLHRCPNRYSQLSDHERDMRKRIFWSAYVLDRYLSQGLGIPLGFQDSDIDVCMPGKEKHRAMSSRSYHAGLPRQDSTSSGVSSGSVQGPSASHADGRRAASPDSSHNVERNDTPSNHQEHVHKDIVLVGLVGYSQLTGRAIELFHKSINVRSVDHTKILYITADIHSWYNSLPMKLTSVESVVFPNGEPLDEAPPSFVPLFTVLYQQLLLLVNRPCLSLPSKSPEFLASMQTCIGASRTIIGALEMQLQLRQPFFLPELLSAGWMAGLILVFACQLHFYPSERGFKEISQCLRLLRLMKDHWKSAMTYYQTLTRLFSELKAGHNSKNTPNPAKRPGSEEIDYNKRARYMNHSMGNGYNPADLDPSAAIRRALTAPNSSYGRSQNQSRSQSLQNMSSSRNSSSTPDINAPSHQSAPFHSPDSSQHSGSQGSTPQPQLDQSFPASHYIFTPPGPDPAHLPADAFYSDPSNAGLADAELIEPLLGDPSVNELDLFGSVSWGSLNGDYSYNAFNG